MLSTLDCGSTKIRESNITIDGQQSILIEYTARVNRLLGKWVSGIVPSGDGMTRITIFCPASAFRRN